MAAVRPWSALVLVRAWFSTYVAARSCPGRGAVMINRQWLLRRRPSGRAIKAGDFERRDGQVPKPSGSEVLIEVSHLAFDPSMKSWMENAVSYFPPVALGDVMPGEGLGLVVESASPRFAGGDLVSGFTGWQDYAVLPADALRPVPPDIDPRSALAALGSSGLTAFFGLFEIGRPVAGDLLLVSSAAGAVGSMAGQFGRLAGCRVVGIAGSPTKCAWLTGELGFDLALDRMADDFSERLAAACPDGIDIFFDNVGGSLLNAALGRIARRGRIIICGGMSRHEPGRAPTSLDNYYNLVFQRARMEGFNVVDFRHREHEARRRIELWLREGSIACHLGDASGFERAPEMLIGLYRGKGLGKRVLRIDDAG